MRKEYMKPEAEKINFQSEEEVMAGVQPGYGNESIGTPTPWSFD